MSQQNSDTSVPARIAQATALHQQGRLVDALALYSELIAHHPDLYSVWLLSGIARLQTGQMSDAAHALRRATALNPADPMAHANLGSALQALGDHDAAMQSFQAALTLSPGHADARFKLGVSLMSIGRYDEALASFQAVATANPGHAGALNNAGECLRRMGRLDETIAYFDRALAIDDRYVDARLNRGTALLESGRPLDALSDFDHALASAPAHPIALNNRGNTMASLGRDSEALAAFDAVVAAHPAYADAWVNRANVLSRRCRYDEAMASLERACAADPTSASARWSRGLLRLLFGNFREGWQDYEARWVIPSGFEKPRHANVPIWTGAQDVRGKRVLLWHEQGLGDTIQFSRYAHDVAALGATPVLEVQAPLKTLLSSSFPSFEVRAQGEAGASCDISVPMMSLPFALNAVSETPTLKAPYLRADPKRVAEWHALLGPRRAPLRVGLAISGNPAHRNDRNRSLPVGLIAELDGLADFFIVQKGLRDGDAAVLTGRAGFRDAGDCLNDFADTAALIATLDLVISVDTAIAHLAGALGKPVWILVPANPDWRWRLDRDDTNWYGSARLFRQRSPGDWPDVIARIAGALRATQRDS